VLTILLGLIFGCLLLLLALAIWFLVAGGRWGWVQAALAFGGYAFAASWLTLRWQRPKTRRRAAMGMGALFAGIGIAAAHWAPPTPARLRHEIEEFVQPGWKLTKDEINGSRACWDVCTSVTRAYRVDLEADDVLSDLAPLLAERGLRESNLSEGSRTTFSEAHAGGDMDIWIDVVREGDRLTTVYVTADANS
jgi:hypothetical protein